MVVKSNARIMTRLARRGTFDFTEAMLLFGLAAGAKLLNLW